MGMKDSIRQLTPPVLISLAKRLSGYEKKSSCGLSGGYRSWDEALAASTGYDSAVILEKTREALLKVKSGEAVYERDSVLFDEIQYAWPLLAGLMWAAAQSGGRLDILDFGGSLGSAYFQNRAFLERLPAVRWNVVEQAAHVREGRKSFEDESLKFYESIEECLAHTAPNVALLSGVLQYLEQPYDLLADVLALPCDSVIIDRTPFHSGDSDRLCVQHIDPAIFDASYPMWVFSMDRFREALGGREVLEEFEGFENGMFGLMWKGFILGGMR